jgi:hypothetical protein
LDYGCGPGEGERACHILFVVSKLVVDDRRVFRDKEMNDDGKAKGTN